MATGTEAERAAAAAATEGGGAAEAAPAAPAALPHIHPCSGPPCACNEPPAWRAQSLSRKRAFIDASEGSPYFIRMGKTTQDMDRYSDRYKRKTVMSATEWDKGWAAGNDDLKVKTGTNKAGRGGMSTVRAVHAVHVRAFEAGPGQGCIPVVCLRLMWCSFEFGPAASAGCVSFWMRTAVERHICARMHALRTYTHHTMHLPAPPI